MKQWVARESSQELQGGFAAKPLTHKGRTIRNVMHGGMQGKMIACIESVSVGLESKENPRKGFFFLLNRKETLATQAGEDDCKIKKKKTIVQ